VLDGNDKPGRQTRNGTPKGHAMTRETRTAKRSTRRSDPAGQAAKVDALLQQLNDAVAELASGEAWTAMLRVAAKFSHYSARNVMLLWVQAEERGTTLTRVAGFRTWLSMGRAVRKGERGYRVLAPVRRRLSEAEAAERGPGGYDAEGKPATAVRGFRIEHVFDITQTDGEPLLELGDVARPATLTGDDPDGLWGHLSALVEAEGFRIERQPETGDTQGWTNYTNRVVSVRPDIPAAQAAYVLAHELGHIRAGHEHRRDVSRDQRETEAESIAYIVATACGIDSAISSTPYVAGWSEGDPEILTAAADLVRREAARILAELCGGAPDEDDVTASSAA
jgi:antirestriction protein ArdC